MVISMVVIGKIIIVTIGTIVLVVTVAQLISQLRTPIGLEWFQMLPAEMQVQVMHVTAQQSPDLLRSLATVAPKSRVDAATVMTLLQSFQTFTASM